jgi:hypothetical protein
VQNKTIFHIATVNNFFIFVMIEMAKSLLELESQFILKGYVYIVYLGLNLIVSFSMVYFLPQISTNNVCNACLVFHLSSGLNFTNIFTSSFYKCSSRKHKNSVTSSVSFYAFGIYRRKSCL